MVLGTPEHLTARHTTITNKESFGDTYGTVNALFAGLAFAVLLGTIVLGLASGEGGSKVWHGGLRQGSRVPKLRGRGHGIRQGSLTQPSSGPQVAA